MLTTATRVGFVCLFTLQWRLPSSMFCFVFLTKKKEMKNECSNIVCIHVYLYISCINATSPIIIFIFIFNPLIWTLQQTWIRCWRETIALLKPTCVYVTRTDCVPMPVLCSLRICCRRFPVRRVQWPSLEMYLPQRLCSNPTPQNGTQSFFP